MRPARIIIVLLWLSGGSACAAAQPPFRYEALLSSGQRIESDRLSNWGHAQGVPSLGGKSLLDPANPLRWLRDRSHRWADPPESYIEFTNGDRLPGLVVDYRGSDGVPFCPQPPHLVVRALVPLETPTNGSEVEIRVLTQFVRRIVWHRRGGELLEPGTARCEDGRALSFRAAHFRTGEVELLAPEGIRRLPWHELAELHLPSYDPWQAWFDQIAAVCPTPAARLIQLETSAGLVATASLARLVPRGEGNSVDPEGWVHGLQPAWSLDILWVPFHQIACYRSFATHEVALSSLPARTTTSGGGLAVTRVPRVNRSVLGTPLRSQLQQFGWGWGVAGGTELTFDLPPGVRSFRSWVCLDRTAGNGGCIRPRVLRNDPTGPVLWDGPILEGSQEVIAVGPLDLSGASTRPQALVLQIDPVIYGRPPGADPFEIRDHADWCDPILELDPAVVQGEWEQRLSRLFFAWHDWHCEVLDGTPSTAGLEVSFHRNSGLPGAFETAVRVAKLPLVLRRELPIGPRDRWLAIVAARPLEGRDEPGIEVRIDGQVAGDFTVPSSQGGLRGVTVPLPSQPRSGSSSVPVEIRQRANPHSPAVHYYAITTLEQRPSPAPQRGGPSMRVPTPLPPSDAAISVNVSNVQQLLDAIRHLQSGSTINIAAGRYDLSGVTDALYIPQGIRNWTVRGATGQRDDIVIQGAGMKGSVRFGFWVGNSPGGTIADLTIDGVKDHGIILNPDADRTLVHNVRIVDSGDQFLKSNPDPSGHGNDLGVVEDSVFEYRTTDNDNYSNGVDVLGGDGWIVRGNLFKNILYPPGQGIAGPAVLFWKGSKNATVEGNAFVNCARGVSLGLVDRAEGFDHQGGIVQNNMFYREAQLASSVDVPILIADSPRTKVYHNTIIAQGSYPNAIEYRFASSKDLDVKNNLSDGAIQARDGATATQGGNITTAALSLFVNPSAGDLHLVSGASPIDRGLAIAGFTKDIDGQTRVAPADVGADEFVRQ